MMFEIIATVAAWACFAFIVYATVAPIEQRPALPNAINIGRLEHVGAFALFGGIFCVAYPHHTFALLVFVVCTASLLELAQTFRQDRHGRLSDALWKVAGGVVGVFVAHFLRNVTGQLTMSGNWAVNHLSFHHRPWNGPAAVFSFLSYGNIRSTRRLMTLPFFRASK